jgi:hypothetical protein
MSALPAPIENQTPWHEYIDRKRRRNFLAILEELSRRQDKHAPDFLLIGALALAMQNYLRYVAWWDIDLLFRSEEALQKFAKSITAPGLRIEHLDDEVVSTADLVCLHTMWSFGGTWANVDYIYRPQRFPFFHETLCHQAPFSQTIRLENREYHLNLLLGHPWDIFADKLTLRRTVEQLQNKDAFGIDLRHLVLILRQDHATQNFWKHIVKKSAALPQKDVLREMLMTLIEIAPELGYEVFCRPQEVAGYFGNPE